MELLTEERRLNLEIHRAELRSYINLRDSILLDVLMDNDCICDIDKQAILEGEYEGAQTDKLISLLLRRTNHHYSMFCDALIATQQSHIVLHYLTTANDIENVRQKLAEVYAADAKMDFYTADGQKYSHRLDKLYTPMTWSERRIGAAKVKEVPVQSENQILQELQTCCQKVIIEGPVGSGKSTFIKKLCSDWSNSVKVQPRHENESVANFRVLINISMHYVRPQDDLTTTLSFQMPFLTQLEILAILNLIQNDPKSVLFILDGLEEGQSRNSLLLKTITTGNTPYLVTTKSHYNPNLDTSLYRIFRLLGFNKQQIRQYIMDYFDGEEESVCNIEDLTDLLFNDRKDMVQFAKTPIHTRMICVVYDIYKDLGQNISDIFQKFIDNLFNHLRQKVNMTVSNSVLLTKLGHLAMNLDTKLKYQSFSKEMMEKYIGCDTEMVLALGLVHKVDPKNVLEEGTWQFTYPDFQHYFIAYYLANSPGPNVLEEFLSNVPSETWLTSYELAIRFLCYLDQEKAITILEKLVQKKELSSYINGVLEMFEPLRSAEISNHQPTELKIDTSVLTPSCFSLCHKFFILDKSESEKLTLKTMDDILNYNVQFLSQVKSLRISIHGDVTVAAFLNEKHVNGLKKMCNVEQLCIDAHREVMEQILMYIPQENISTVKLKGHSVISSVVACLPNLPSARKIYITELDSKADDYEMGKFCAYVLSCRQLREFHMVASNIHKAYADISEKVDVDMKIKQFDTKQIKCFWEHLDSKGNGSQVKCLNISGRKLVAFEKPGILYYLGLSFPKMPELNTLTLQDRILEAKGMLQFFKSTKFAQQFREMRNLRNLNICRNQLKGAGHLLGELLTYLNSLITLDISSCGLDNEDMMAFGNSIKKTKLRQLNLSKNDLYQISGLQLLFTKLEQLHTLHLCGCFSKYSNEVSVASAFSKRMEKLQHLYLSKNLISSKDFEDIAQKMMLFPSLKCLVLSKCWCSDAKCAFTVLQHSPSSLIYLDLSCNVFSLQNFTEYVSSTSPPAHKFQNLVRLNIGTSGNNQCFSLIQRSLRSCSKLDSVQVYFKPKEHSCKSEDLNNDGFIHS